MNDQWNKVTESLPDPTGHEEVLDGFEYGEDMGGGRFAGDSGAFVYVAYKTSQGECMVATATYWFRRKKFELFDELDNPDCLMSASHDDVTHWMIHRFPSPPTK